MSWVESESEGFSARHDEGDADDVARMLAQLAATRERLAAHFGPLPGQVAVVVHGSQAQLDLAQPFLPLVRRGLTPAARRYLAGWAGRATIHVLAPRVLAERASGVEDSRDMLMLTPAALYVQLVVGAVNPLLPPPWGARAILRARRWSWLAAGTAQWFSGQTALARPVIARRLREGGRTSFPPRMRDAIPLGGTIVDLLAREEGEAAVVRLARTAHRDAPAAVLEAAFRGRALAHTEQAWRAHLARLAGEAPAGRRRRRSVSRR